jgi:hypothetical protein
MVSYDPLCFTLNVVFAADRSSHPPQAKGVAKEAAGEKPKRPLGSYFIFQAERRDKVKAANPGISVKEIASKIGEEWRALSDAQKQK